MFNKPYHFRILGCLPGHAPIEIARSQEKYSNYAWNYWTRGIAPEWTVWSEHPMDDRDCLSPRPQPKPIRSTTAASSHLLKIANYEDAPHD